MTHFPDTDPDVVLVVKAERSVITHAGFPDREVDPVCQEVALVPDTEVAQIGNASDLREEEVIPVVDDPLQVCLAETHPLAMREWKIHGRLAG